MIPKENPVYRHILALAAFFLCLALALPVQAAKEEPVTTVILVRHGQTDYNKEGRYQGFLDIPLNIPAPMCWNTSTASGSWY